MEELFLQLIEAIKQASPQVWATIAKQVRLEACSDLVWAAVLILVSIALLFAAKWFWKKHKEDEYGDWEQGTYLIAPISVIALIIALCLLTSGIKGVINPEFYAIRYIIESLQ
jgi:uncharacterized membrane protein YidH (DUF202 family)